MKSKKKVVILTEGQVNSLMENLRAERDKKIQSEMRNQENSTSELEHREQKFLLSGNIDLINMKFIPHIRSYAQVKLTVIN